jgi:hypothetical protein
MARAYFMMVSSNRADGFRLEAEHGRFTRRFDDVLRGAAMKIAIAAPVIASLGPEPAAVHQQASCAVVSFCGAGL